MSLLYCIVLYCIVLYCIVLYCIVLHCIIMRRVPNIAETSNRWRLWTSIVAYPCVIDPRQIAEIELIVTICEDQAVCRCHCRRRCHHQ